MAWTTSGTCEWEIDSNGLLTVRPIDLVSGTLETWTAGASVPWYAYEDAITSVVFESGCIAQTCYYMFNGCSSLVSVDLSGLDTSGVTTMGAMFYGCSLLEKLVLGAATTLRNDTNQWNGVPTTWYKYDTETSTTLTELIALSGTAAGASTWTTYINLANSASVPVPTSSVDFGDTAAGTFTPVVSTNTFTGYAQLGTSIADLTVDNTGSYSVVIPETWAAEIPSASSGIATVYLLTYDDTATLLGTESATFTINIPTTWAPTVTLTLTSSDGDQDYIVNSSYIIASAAASDLHYATETWSLSCTDGTSSSTSSLNTNVLTDAIEYTVTATLTDSRGNVVTETASVTPSAYTYPVPDGSVELGNTATGTFDPDTGITYTGTITLGTSSVDW